MIETSTVLILGAGSSYPYHFPLGRELTDIICRDLISGSAQGKTLVDNTHFLPYQIDQFQQALLGSKQMSVDAFLEKRTEYLEIGKAAIALQLMPFEELGNLRTPRTVKNVRSDWYQYLLARLTEGVKREEFSKNKLSVITLNYDRSLEFYLFSTLSNTYGTDEPATKTLMRHIPIIHIHGHLGTPHFYSEKGRDYVGEITRDSITTAMTGIRIVHENIDDTKELKAARTLIRQAQNVCFLGFGYHDVTLDRLQLNAASTRSQKIFGSATYLGGARRNRIVNRFNNRIMLGDEGEDVLEFLRHHPILE
jgi:hypothetical protein